WATHFIAMLAYDPGVTIAYNIGLTALSLIAAALVTAGGLAVAVYVPGRWSAPAGGALVGGGLARLHYTRTWALGLPRHLDLPSPVRGALERPGHVPWRPGPAVGRAALGMLLGMAALLVAARRATVRAMAPAAVLLTLAIVSHHFTAMGAVEIAPDPTRVVAAF